MTWRLGSARNLTQRSLKFQVGPSSIPSQFKDSFAPLPERELSLGAERRAAAVRRSSGRRAAPDAAFKGAGRQPSYAANRRCSSGVNSRLRSSLSAAARESSLPGDASSVLRCACQAAMRAFQAASSRSRSASRSRPRARWRRLACGRRRPRCRLGRGSSSARRPPGCVTSSGASRSARTLAGRRASQAARRSRRCASAQPPDPARWPSGERGLGLGVLRAEQGLRFGVGEVRGAQGQHRAQALAQRVDAAGRRPGRPQVLQRGLEPQVAPEQILGLARGARREPAVGSCSTSARIAASGRLRRPSSASMRTGGSAKATSTATGRPRRCRAVGRGCRRATWPRASARRLPARDRPRAAPARTAPAGRSRPAPPRRPRRRPGHG